MKVVDLLAPYRRVVKMGLFVGAGVGKTVRTHYRIDQSTTLPKLMKVYLYL